jgi:redox-sensitive bicupin YhaK (pirin superfamily)
VLLDEFKSRSKEDYIAGFPGHPHRGIETVTYMINGQFRHHDSRGGGGLLNPGSVQWMTAGRGIIHSEMPQLDRGLLWGFQLWISLPARDKLTEPKYQHVTPDRIPWIAGEGSLVKVMAGDYKGHTGPIQPHSPVVFLDVHLADHGYFTFSVPAGFNACAYVHSGAALVDPTGRKEMVPVGSLAVLKTSGNLAIRGATENTGLLFLAGRPHKEAIVRGGPFVMNNQDQIEQAYRDYTSGELF